MKNKMLKSITFLVAASVFMGGTMSVFAEGTNTPKKENSAANIQFELDTETTDPINPVDPTDPTDPGDVDGGNDKNALSIIAYPKTMSFGKQKIGKGLQSYEADLLKPNIQIRDIRGASSDGWNLSVGLSQFENSSVTGEGQFVDAVLEFSNTKMFSHESSGDAKPSVVNETISVKSGQNSQIASAKKGEGLGVWGFHWYAPNQQSDQSNSNVKLKLNTNEVAVGSYTGNLEWTLSATPN